jgi:hypothetical protein
MSSRGCHLHRRDHREPVVRGQRRLAVARGGLRAEPLSDRSWRSCSSAPARGALRPGIRRRGDATRRARRATPMATRGACSTCSRSCDGGGRGSAARRRDFLDDTLAQNLRRFDKGGEAFYDQISALHKSVRGSNPDAALYWLCRMLDGGADPRYLARRIVRMAVEDIGLADPRALRSRSMPARPTSASARRKASWRWPRRSSIWPARPNRTPPTSRIMPRALSSKHDGSRPVPLHLRNAPTKLMKDARLRQGIPLRARRGPAPTRPASATSPTACRSPSWYQPTRAGWSEDREKLAHLRALDAMRKGGRSAKNSQTPNPRIKNRLRTEIPCSTYNCCAPTSPPSPPGWPTRGSCARRGDFPRARGRAQGRCRCARRTCRRSATASRSRSAMLKGKGEDTFRRDGRSRRARRRTEANEERSATCSTGVRRFRLR